MTELDELRTLSLDFRRVSSNLLRTTCNDGNVHIIRFIDFINNHVVLKRIIDDAIIKSNATYDRQSFFPTGKAGLTLLHPLIKTIMLNSCGFFLMNFWKTKMSIFFQSDVYTRNI
jgi:hypothetical protein